MADSYVYPNAPRGKRDYDENSERRQRPRNSSGSDVCYDFQKGRCNRGQNCRFSHGEENGSGGGARGGPGRDDRRGGSMNGLVKINAAETYGDKDGSPCPSSGNWHDLLDVKLQKMSLHDDSWIEPKAKQTVITEAVKVATNVYSLKQWGVAAPTIHHYEIVDLKKTWVLLDPPREPRAPLAPMNSNDQEPAPADVAPDVAPADVAPAALAPAEDQLRDDRDAEDFFADGSRVPKETARRRVFEAIAALGATASSMCLWTDGAKQVYATEALGPEAAVTVKAPVAGVAVVVNQDSRRKQRQWRISLRKVSELGVADWYDELSKREDVFRSPSGELVDACSGQRCQMLTVLELALGAHMRQHGLCDVGNGRYLNERRRKPVGACDLRMGVEAKIKRVEAGLVVSADLIAKLVVRSDDRGTIADLIFQTLGRELEHRELRDDEAKTVRQLIKEKMVTILRIDPATERLERNETGQISPRTFKVPGQPGVLRAVPARDQTFEFRGRTISVAEYQREKGAPLRYPHLPCFVFDQGLVYDFDPATKARTPRLDEKGKKVRNLSYFPVERGVLESGQRAVGISAPQEMIQVLGMPPAKKLQEVAAILKMSKAASEGENVNLRAIGFELSSEPVSVWARCFPRPLVRMRMSPRGHFELVRDKDGKKGEWKPSRAWATLGVEEIRRWVVIDATLGRGPGPGRIDDFAKTLRDVLKNKGVDISEDYERATLRHASYDDIVDAINPRAELVICVIMHSSPGVSDSIYGKLKLWSNLNVGVTTQCVTAELLKKQNRGFDGIALSIAAKINAKSGGVNRYVKDVARPEVSDDDFSAWTGETYTCLIGVQVVLGSGYDEGVPPVVTACSTADRRCSKFVHTAVPFDRNEKIGFGLEDRIGTAARAPRLLCPLPTIVSRRRWRM